MTTPYSAGRAPGVGPHRAPARDAPPPMPLGPIGVPAITGPIRTGILTAPGGQFEEADTPAGWYKVPVAKTLRWWDGMQWTDWIWTDLMIARLRVRRVSHMRPVWFTLMWLAPAVALLLLLAFVVFVQRYLDGELWSLTPLLVVLSAAAVAVVVLAVVISVRCARVRYRLLPLEVRWVGHHTSSAGED